MSKVEQAVKFMEQIAADDRHGYSQINRNGNPDYDCSSLVIAAFTYAGFPVKSYGASYTGNMRSAFLACGFKDIIRAVDVYSGKGLKRGDILLNQAYHTAVYCGNGKLVHAASDENRGIRGARQGDQTGREICVAPYANYWKGWDCVLRFEEPQPAPIPQPIPQSKAATQVPILDNLIVDFIPFVVNGLSVSLHRILKDNSNYIQVQDLLKQRLLTQEQYSAISKGSPFTTFLHKDLRYVKLADLAQQKILKVEYNAATKTVYISK